jgi:hypothetical protein
MSSLLGDTALGLRAYRALAAGVAIALTLSFVLGRLVGLDPEATELGARTTVDLPDLVGSGAREARHLARRQRLARDVRRPAGRDPDSQVGRSVRPNDDPCPLTLTLSPAHGGEGTSEPEP